MFARYLYRITVKEEFSDMYGFIDPHHFVTKYNRWGEEEESKKHLTEIISNEGCQKTCYIGAFGDG